MGSVSLAPAQPAISRHASAPAMGRRCLQRSIRVSMAPSIAPGARSAEAAANRIDLVVVAGHDVGLVAQRFGPGVPVVAVAGSAVGGDALAAEAPVDRAVAVHFGVGDHVVAGGAGPEMIRSDVHVAGVVDQRAVEPALPLGGLVAH